MKLLLDTHFLLWLLADAPQLAEHVGRQGFLTAGLHEFSDDDVIERYDEGQMRRFVTPEVNAAATGFLALSVLVVTASYFISRKRK